MYFSGEIVVLETGYLVGVNKPKAARAGDEPSGGAEEPLRQAEAPSAPEVLSAPLSLSLSLSHTRTLSHTHTLSLSLSHPISLIRSTREATGHRRARKFGRTGVPRS